MTWYPRLWHVHCNGSLSSEHSAASGGLLLVNKQALACSAEDKEEEVWSSYLFSIVLNI